MENGRTIEAIAAEWWARRAAGPLSASELAAFERWCASDPRCRGAYLRLEAVNVRLAQLVASGAFRPPVEEAPPVRPAIRPPLTHPPVARSPGGMGRGPARWSWSSVGTVAALLALAVAISGDIIRRKDPTLDLATRVGELHRTTLADGSTVELNTATRLEVTLRPDIREISLERGETLFEVAKDKKRPFVIHTPLADVRAVGTAFLVRSDRNHLEVGVRQGVVAIEHGGREIARVSAGQTFDLDPDGKAVRQDRQMATIDRQLAWRDGVLAFAGEPLSEVAAQFNRYNRVKIRIASARIGALHIGGRFKSTDPEGFAAALPQDFAIASHRDGDVIVLDDRLDDRRSSLAGASEK